MRWLKKQQETQEANELLMYLLEGCPEASQDPQSLSLVKEVQDLWQFSDPRLQVEGEFRKEIATNPRLTFADTVRHALQQI